MNPARRRFLEYLAASPLLAGSDLLAQEKRLPDPSVWAPRSLGKLIEQPGDALSVFDFEPVMHKNVRPGHFGYMATGSDDEVTLRANREDFLKFQLLPRRLVDVERLDLTMELFGQTWQSPIVLAPTGSNKAFHDDGELAVARAAPAAAGDAGRHGPGRRAGAEASRPGPGPAGALALAGPRASRPARVPSS